MLQFGLLGLFFVSLFWYRHLFYAELRKFPLLTASMTTEPPTTKVELLVADDWSTLQHVTPEITAAGHQDEDRGPAMSAPYQDENSGPDMSMQDKTSSRPPVQMKLKSTQAMSKTIPSIKSLRNEVDSSKKDIRYIINDERSDDMVVVDKVELVAQRVVDKRSLPVGFQNLTKYQKQYVQTKPREKTGSNRSFSLKPSVMVAFIEDWSYNLLSGGSEKLPTLVGMLTIIISLVFIKKMIRILRKAKHDYDENKASLTMAKSCVDGVNTLLKDVKKEFQRQIELEETCAENKQQALDKLDEMAVRIQSLLEDQDHRTAHNISQLTREKMAALNQVVNAFNSREITLLETQDQVQRRKQLKKERMAVMKSLTDLQSKSSQFMASKAFQ